MGQTAVFVYSGKEIGLQIVALFRLLSAKGRGVRFNDSVFLLCFIVEEKLGGCNFAECEVDTIPALSRFCVATRVDETLCPSASDRTRIPQ